MNKRKTKRWIPGRLAPQIAMVVVVLGGATFRNLSSDGVRLPTIFPELQGLCPIGAVQTISRIFTDPAYVFTTARLNIWVLAGVVAVSIALGAAFCGRLCPLGSIQEWAGKIGRRVLGKRYNSFGTGRIDHITAYLRFVMIGVVFAAVAGWIALDLELVNPSIALAHLWTTAVPITAAVALAIVLAGSFFVERPWCRWLCPYGAVQGTIARFSPWTIRRDEKLCISCGKCDRTCPMAVRIATRPAVRDDRCNRCTVCIAACPVDGALTFSTRGAKNQVRSGIAISIVAVVLFAAPAATVGTIGHLTRQESETRQTQEFSPDSVSPMMTVRELSSAAGIAEELLLEIIGLPTGFDTETVLFDIEDEPGFEHVTVGYVRDAVGEFLAR
ncbi:MAG: 4Fe-4S binding protein [Spirochaetaceae bacterium]|nr:MAG: 4Fe-4S binding protein [Spirochaetaceae bacterium]